MGQDFKDLVNSVSDEVKAKAIACKSPKELLALAEQEGIKLSDEQLESLAAGNKGWGCFEEECTDEASPC